MLQSLKNIKNNQPATQQVDFISLLKKHREEIGRALPAHKDVDRLIRSVQTLYRMNDSLKRCNPYSIISSVIQSAQLGLDIGIMGEAHLVPYGDRCQLVPGYVGLIKLARQSGLVRDVYAHEVREKDTFSLRLGLDRNLEHAPLAGPGGFPAPDEMRGAVVGFYAVAVLNDGTRTFTVLGRTEVEKIRDASSSYQAAKRSKKETPWDTDFVQMGIKTAIRRLCKVLPKSSDLATALTLDAMNDQGGIGYDADGNTLEVGVEQHGPMLVETPSEPTQEAQPEPEQASNIPATTAPAEASEDEIKNNLESIFQQMAAVNTIEALDDVYVRAEGVVSGPDLERLMRAYRKRKHQIEMS